MPAWIATTANGTSEQLIGIVETPLTLTHHTETAKGIGVLGLLFQAGEESLLGNGELIVLQSLETAHQVRALLSSHSGGTATVHLRANFLVIWIGLEISLEQGNFRRPW